MKLSNIMDGIEYRVGVTNNDLDIIEIEDIVYDSRKAKKNTIFVAVKGETVDGHDYVRNAYENGCRAFVLNKTLELDKECIQFIVEDSRATLSKMSKNFFLDPTSQIKVIGVTGTKGKTTITNYIKTVLTECGLNTGVIGTNGVFYNDIVEKTVNTTPESYEIEKSIRKMVDAGVKCVAMEVSSGGLMMQRVDDISFDIGVYTNLSPDHIGPKEHPSFEHYRDSKAKLFKLCKHGIINIDDENAQYIIENASCDISTFSIDKESDFKAENIVLTRGEDSLGVNFDFIEKGKKATNTHICSPGRFSIYNALAVIATCKYFDIDKKAMLEALSKAKVDGRVEVLPVLPYATVVVDYAHNGMSLENVLQTLLKYKPNRMICLFGSVGGRTAIRRRELGDVAAKLCDVSILTTDNPDDEDPMQIINDIAESFIDSKCKVMKIEDRGNAIYEALKMAQKGDMIVIAGKGHEKYQYINGQRVFYDEKAEVINAAKKVLEERNK
ncbi:UDP-N-acetylmuramoyl-L-alanyl-D-glutamate--2,6-diaminopimelate ligase [Peptostreptococcus equinus]|uniref:UDP-N-acetylmuramyl-tripeptide synthetase n=1 Tax=Peptostreptococcus equinus TaxID=3003601 RepID=A0ABY7JRW0_9FIRM|nr:UDP-N-acetylmuramoyl-L-alanyl-D-glutamate--2,6-diaminopimelate ligase [Peptostreptococcus sp. CBA3647]WAW15591.1 UDP-N-acetylmuramoyl-L-alanyl-D-glutamate--2,6-diaminopimelate ligase [Peptostreptococcus sp. CBA3647]